MNLASILKERSDLNAETIRLDSVRFYWSKNKDFKIFIPELKILKALTYLYLCNYNKVKEIIAAVDLLLGEKENKLKLLNEGKDSEILWVTYDTPVDDDD